MSESTISDLTNTDYETYETYSIDSDEKEYFMNESDINDSDDESRETFYSDISGDELEFDECLINKDLLFPELITSCKGQILIDGHKCFKNKCIPVNKIIAQSYSQSC
jgi:hypothetical protein